MDDLINIYIGNHVKKDGIEDYIDILSRIFKNRKINFKVSEGLHPSGVNIVIDEFTNFISNNRIKRLAKSSRKICFIYVLTEFIEKRFMVRSFNHFGGILDSALLAFINLYLRRQREDFQKARFQEYLVFLMLSSIVVAYGVWSLMGNAYKFFRHGRKKSALLHPSQRLHRLIYMHMRYLGFESMISYADSVLLSHDAIAKGYEKFRKIYQRGPEALGVLHPEFALSDLLQKLDNKKLYIEITGTITQYRSQFIREIDKWILLLGIHHEFGLTQCYSFSNVQKIEFNDRGAFSLHPPQSAKWPYSSPTRIYRALCVDKNIPILTKKFNQHPIEDLCLLYHGKETLLMVSELYDDRSKLDRFLNSQVIPYLEKARKNNDFLFKKMLVHPEKKEIQSAAQKALH